MRESKALEGKESLQNPFQLQAQTKEEKEIELRLKEFIERREHCRSSAISRLVFSERKNAFVDAADSTDADVKSSHKDNRSAGDDRPRRSSTSLSKSEEKDVLRKMRKERIEKEKLRQIESALDALRRAPITAPLPQVGAESPGESGRVFLREIHHDDISKELDAAKEELGESVTKLAVEEDILRLLADLAPRITESAAAGGGNESGDRQQQQAGAESQPSSSSSFNSSSPSIPPLPRLS